MHVGRKLEFLLKLSLLIKLHIASFEEMSFDGHNAFDLILVNSPFGNPLACVEFVDANIFWRESNVHIQTTFINFSKDYMIEYGLLCVPFGVLKYLST